MARGDPGPDAASGLSLQEAADLLRPFARRARLEEAPGLDGSRTVLLKREDLGPNRAFKWRGALCACEAFRRRGVSTVVTASTGNHGAAVAWAASRLHLKAHVVVPVDAAETKCRLISRNGAVLHRHGLELEAASAHARELATKLDAVYFEDGALEAQLRGTGSIGRELLHSGADAVLLPVGCGALAAGVASSLAGAPRPPRVIGVQSAAFPRLAAHFHGQPEPPTGRTFADGLADNRIVEPAFSTCSRHLEDILVVDDEAILAAARELWQRYRILVEGAAAAPLAGLRLFGDRIPGQRIVLVVSGANVDPALERRIKGLAA